MRISKTKYNNQKERQELSEEEDQQYGQERFTDRYNEYFEDGENKAEGSPMNITKILQIS
jgi:hypothetical protein